MGQGDVHRYLGHRLRVAGRKEPIFTPDAVDLVYKYSEEVSRWINNLCDIARVIEYSRKQKEIEGEGMYQSIQTERGHGP